MMAKLFSFFLGIDLGQARDYTALSLLEEQLWVDGRWSRKLPTSAEERGWRSPAAMSPENAEKALYLSHSRGRPPYPPMVLKHIERLPLRTPYPAIVDRVREL